MQQLIFMVVYASRFCQLLFFFLSFQILYFLRIVPFECAFRYQATKDDLTVYAALPTAPSDEYGNVSRWYKHIDALLRIS